MRSGLHQADLDRMTNGQCPACLSRGFVLGPMGGSAINIECANLKCRARFNVVPFGGRILMAHPIPSEAEGGGKWPVTLP